MQRSELVAMKLRDSYMIERDADDWPSWESCSTQEYWKSIASRLELSLARDGYYICKMQ